MNRRLGIWAAAMVFAVTNPLHAYVVTNRSLSGQFCVIGPAVIGTALTAVDLNAPRVPLDPSLLVVSCERIKARLLGVLEWPDQWRDRMIATIDPVMTDPRAIVLRAKRYTDCWQYRLKFPREVDRRHLVSTMVEMLLLEMANRNSRSRPAELPPWLAEGLTSIMAVDGLAELTLDPQMTLMRRIPKKYPLAEVKAVLTRRAPLTLDELNWPTDDEKDDDRAKVYEACAHLMVLELLRLEDGSRCLAWMLQILPEYQNWQSAFFLAFRGHFPRVAEWDKWWSLLLVNITNRDKFATWSAGESWSKFEGILNTPIQVHVNEREMPMIAQASLQSIVREWEQPRQTEWLILKLNHLDALRMRAAPEVAGLVEDYREVLREYLRERSQAGAARRLLPGFPEELVQETVTRLDELDQRRITVLQLLDVAKSNRRSSSP